MLIEIQLAAVDGKFTEKIEIDDNIYVQLQEFAKANNCKVEDVLNFILLNEFENNSRLTNEE